MPDRLPGGKCKDKSESGGPCPEGTEPQGAGAKVGSGEEAGDAEHPGTLGFEGGWVGGSVSHEAVTTGHSRDTVPLGSPVNRLGTLLLQAMGLLSSLAFPPGAGVMFSPQTCKQAAWSLSVCPS